MTVPENASGSDDLIYWFTHTLFILYLIFNSVYNDQNELHEIET